MEELNYYVEKKGSGGIKVISKTKIRVSKTKYKKWALNEISGMKFQEWYNDRGEWKNGEFIKGTKTLSDGNFYVGEFKYQLLENGTFYEKKETSISRGWMER